MRGLLLGMLMATRIRRGQYSLWLPSYSLGLATGYGMGLPGLLGPRVESYAHRLRPDHLVQLQTEVKAFTFRPCGRPGHLPIQEAMLDPLPYGSNRSFADRAHFQGSGRPHF